MVSRHLKRLSKDWFLGGMITAVLMATLFPEVGKSGGAMHADVASDVGIFMVFLLHGLGLSTESMLRGMSRWRLHVVVQTFTFVVFPLLYLVFQAAFSSIIPPDLMLGFLYLCALPSTISSSVAMTAIGKGNVPGAIFNATLSSLLGIFLTPLIVSLGAGAIGTGGLSLSHTIVNIAELLLLPFIVGQVLRPFIGGWFSRYKKYINTFDKLVILILVYAAFCDSVAAGLWTNYGIGTIGLTLAGAAVILVTVLFLTSRTAALLGFNFEDKVTAVMCGSKKTLASGVPMAKLLFGAHPAIGLIVLPIMFYHQLQLFVCSIVAGRYAKQAESASETVNAGASVLSR